MMQFIRSSIICARVLSNSSTVLKCNNFFFSNFTYSKLLNNANSNLQCSLYSSCLPIIAHNRSIFIYRSGDLLWEGVTGAPGRGKKRARGKRRVVRNKVDLNFGRKIGENQLNYKWPGLNAPVFDEKIILRRTIGEKDDSYEKKIIELRNNQNKKRFHRFVPPLKRGWTGSNMGGQSLGKPDPVIGQDWEGYDSRILEVKVVSSMTASKGRFGRFSTVVMVGNGRGLAGIGKAKSTNLRNALRIAKKRATQRFEYYEIRESRTLWHPDFIHDWSTNIFVRPMPEGSGLVCHRLIKTMCDLIGIKDMYAKVEGSVKNYQVITRAFAALLRKQETYQQMADRLALNVVEMRTEHDNYPRLLAAPSTGITRSPGRDEMLDFNRLHLGGHVFWSKRYRPFYLDEPGPMLARQRKHKYRNQDTVEQSRKVLHFLADHGHVIKQTGKIDGDN